jgi:periplasmic protein CpxP/Spy
MKAELIETVQAELKRFATDLNLSDDQKTQLKTALENAHERIEEARERNPNVTRLEVAFKVREARGAIRERLVSFLTPEQLKKWDQEVTKAKTFLGEQVES